MRVLILGAGFGGLELAARLSETLGDQIAVTLIDQSDHFSFGFSKFDVMFSKQTPEETTLPYSAISMAGVSFRQEAIQTIDPERKVVVTDKATHEADVLAIALGADYQPSATPGLVEYGRDFYSMAGARRLRDELPNFPGGNVVVAVMGPLFKCPPAPTECALLMHDYLLDRGLRDTSTITLVTPFPTPLPVSEEVGGALLAEMTDRGIGFVGNARAAAIEDSGRTVRLGDGTTLPADLVLGVPIHVAPRVVVDSGLTENGWIATDRYTLRTRWPDVFAYGDVAAVGVPRAGVFAEGQARVVAEQVIAKYRAEADGARYAGAGTCYVEFGKGKVGTVDVNFLSGPEVTAILRPPSAALREEKANFGATRRARWFNLSA
jgi:sulfide:quinone oxidoreductase